MHLSQLVVCMQGDADMSNKPAFFKAYSRSFCSGVLYCNLRFGRSNLYSKLTKNLLYRFSSFGMPCFPKESEKPDFVSDLLFQLDQITFDIKNTSPYQHYDEVLLLYSRCFSPHSHIWSRIGMRDFPRSVKLYSTFGGICGYSSR